ncbi:hypothetical protein L1987_04880 [Smallanthus sonchifolius]|uniref:Uncharacterized protein n=1 Tax=Smallanthus sonchifolius TaxID=185202 RepID=A0ACB9JU53_9ASTR|nr:hypothetical protein L1987_04880 [Smallanthus sonchifolius]
MKHLPKHPNIVTLKDTYEDDNAVQIVMELCEGGELFDRIVARGHYTERAAASIMRTIVEIVQMCHSHGVMHRDLKPENFLFGNKKETAPLKAIDFGLSVFFQPGEIFNEIVGSPYYMAPEVLKRNYGPEVDVWSAGVILYILICGVPPFWAETEQGVAQAIIHSVINFKRDPWPKISDNVKDLVVAEHLSVEEVAGIREDFHMIDTDNKGKINLEELRIGLQKRGHQVNDADLQNLMESADVDRDGTLDFGEFVALHLKRTANDEHLHKAFEFFDKNQTGYIEVGELCQVLSDEGENTNEEVINAIMHDVDINKLRRICCNDEGGNRLEKSIKAIFLRKIQQSYWYLYFKSGGGDGGADVVCGVVVEEGGDAPVEMDGGDVAVEEVDGGGGDYDDEEVVDDGGGDVVAVAVAVASGGVPVDAFFCSSNYFFKLDILRVSLIGKWKSRLRAQKVINASKYYLEAVQEIHMVTCCVTCIHGFHFSPSII